MPGKKEIKWAPIESANRFMASLTCFWNPGLHGALSLLAAVARSHHTLAPVPFYSCNKHWGGGQGPHRRFALQGSAKHVQRG